MPKQNQKMMKVLITILGLVVAVLGAYFTYQQYKLAKKNEIREEPEVIVCLKSFSYSKVKSHGHGSGLYFSPQVKTSFKLINRRSTQVTVTNVSFNPTGTTKDGNHRGMSGIEVELNKMVPGNGVVTIDNLSFSPKIAVRDRSWINKPESVNVYARMVGGIGPSLSHIYSNGRWRCNVSDCY